MNCDLFEVIEDNCIFKLHWLMAAMGLTEDKPKNWCHRHGIKSRLKGKTWWFSGDMFLTDLEEAKKRGNLAG